MDRMELKKGNCWGAGRAGEKVMMKQWPWKGDLGEKVRWKSYLEKGMGRNEVSMVKVQVAGGDSDKTLLRRFSLSKVCLFLSSIPAAAVTDGHLQWIILSAIEPSQCVKTSATLCSSKVALIPQSAHRYFPVTQFEATTSAENEYKRQSCKSVTKTERKIRTWWLQTWEDRNESAHLHDWRCKLHVSK